MPGPPITAAQNYRLGDRGRKTWEICIHSACTGGKLLHMLIISVVLLPTYLTQILWLFPGRVALGPLKRQ